LEFLLHCAPGIYRKYLSRGRDSKSNYRRWQNAVRLLLVSKVFFFFRFVPLAKLTKQTLEQSIIARFLPISTLLRRLESVLCPYNQGRHSSVDFERLNIHALPSFQKKVRPTTHAFSHSLSSALVYIILDAVILQRIILNLTRR
jgi:hypothetical protein